MASLVRLGCGGDALGVFQIGNGGDDDLAAFAPSLDPGQARPVRGDRDLPDGMAAVQPPQRLFNVGAIRCAVRRRALGQPLRNSKSCY